MRDHEAVVAENTRVWSGGIEPLPSPELVTTLSGVASPLLSIYRHGAARTDDQFMWSWTTDVNVTRGAIAEDTRDTLFFTGSGAPKWADNVTGDTGSPMPGTTYTLGLPVPANTPSVAVTGAAGGVPVTVTVVYTYKTSRGWVGPASAPSAEIDLYPGQTLDIGNLSAAVAGHDINAWNFYVSQTDADGNTSYRYLGAVATSAGAGPHSFLVQWELLGEPLQDPDPLPPPSGLFGLMMHPSGFAVGFTDRLVCRSEFYKPWGWPVEYQDPVPDDIVGGGLIGGTIVVCTKRRTYLFTGNDPLNQQKIALEGWQACVSKRSIAQVTGGVLYASPDGLVLVAASGAMSIVTANHFTRDEWQALKPDSMMGVVHDDRYLLFYDTGSVKGSYIIEFGAEGIQTLVSSTQHATAAYADHRNDVLYLAGNDSTHGRIWKWSSENGAYLSFRWRSGLTFLDRPQAVGAVRVRGDDYPFTFRLYDQEGTEVYEIDVDDDRPIWLPGDNRLRGFSWEIEGAGLVRQVSVASSPLELRGG